MEQQAPSENNFLLDVRIVCGIGLGNNCCHIAGQIPIYTAGVIWQYIRVPQIDTNLPISYFGGYLILIALASALLFLYLIIFYCLQRPDAKHLRTLRLVSCVITLTISIAVLVMVSIKSKEYLQHGGSSDSKQSVIVITINVMDFLYTFFAIPSYIFLAVGHYKELHRRNALEEVRENPLTERGSSRALEENRDTPEIENRQEQVENEIAQTRQQTTS